jgi:quinol monooxygenase YgiN
MTPMKRPSNIVSIHPYFKVHPGKIEEFTAALPKFIERAATEPGNLHYDFTVSGDVVFCREAYIGADGLLAHLENVGPLLRSQLQISDVVRLEVHGPAAELEKLKGPLADLKPVWFTYLMGVER